MSSPDVTNGASGHPRQRGSSEEYIDHSQYFIMHTGGDLPVRTEWVDGQLLFPAPDEWGVGGVSVMTGTMFGPVMITVETYDTAADAVPDTGAWEIVQEVGLVARGSDLNVVTEPLVETGLPRLRLAPGEAAGVRLHARGYRQAAELGDIIGPDATAVEHHLLQLWRA